MTNNNAPAHRIAIAGRRWPTVAGDAIATSVTVQATTAVGSFEKVSRMLQLLRTGSGQKQTSRRRVQNVC